MRKTNRVCDIPGCGEKHFGKGFCNKHYHADYRKTHVEQRRALHKAWTARNPTKVKANAAKSYQTHKEAYNTRSAAWYAANTTKRLAKQREWYDANKDRQRALTRAWIRKHPEINNAKSALWRAKKFQATPRWANNFFIEEIYDLAQRRTKVMGFPWHVDHIVPLQHPLVCGLHCEQNLRVIPAVENISKRNFYWPDMP